MAGRELERRLRRAIHRPPLSEMAEAQHDELRTFLDGAQTFEDLPGKWQAAIAAAEAAAPAGLRRERT